MHFCFRGTHCYNRAQSRDKRTILAACSSRFFRRRKCRFGAGISSVLKTPLVLIIFIFHSIISENIIEGHRVVIQPRRSRNQKKGKAHQSNSRLITKRDTAAKYPDTTRTAVMTDTEKRIKIVRSGLEVNEILDSSLHTILHSSWKGRKRNNQRNVLPLSKTNKSLFSTHGIFEGPGSNLAVIPDDIIGVEREGSSSLKPSNHPSLDAAYFQSLDKSSFQNYLNFLPKQPKKRTEPLQQISSNLT